MATHSSMLAWRILWPEEPDRLQSMGLQEFDISSPQPLTTTLQRPIYCISFYLVYHDIMPTFNKNDKAY